MKQKKQMKFRITEEMTRPRSGHVNLSGMGAHESDTTSKKARQIARNEAERAFREGWKDNDDFYPESNSM